MVLGFYFLQMTKPLNCGRYHSALGFGLHFSFALLRCTLLFGTVNTSLTCDFGNCLQGSLVWVSAVITLVYMTGPALTALLHSVDFLSFLACFLLAFALK